MTKSPNPRVILASIVTLTVIGLLLAYNIFSNSGFVLIIPTMIVPLALTSILFIRKYQSAAVGGLIGWFFFFKDYDYFMNAGGPETPLCNSIRAVIGVYGPVTGVVIPALLLVFTGIIVGLLCPFIYRHLKHREK
jgi:hypothetical protein